MKPDKKYNIIIGILFFASLVGVFLPLIEISIVKISIFDVIKAAAGSGDLISQLGVYGDSLAEYLGPYVIFVVIILLVPILAGILEFITSRKSASVVGIVGAVINLCFILIILIKTWEPMSEMKEYFEEWGVGLVSVHYNILTLILWIGINILIIILSLTARGAKTAGHTDFIPNTPPVYGSRPKNTNIPVQRTAAPQSAPIKRAPAKNMVNPDYHGAVKGVNGIYKGKVYMLQRLTEVGIYQTEGSIRIGNPSSDAAEICKIYFVDKYQEYCLTAYEARKVFLKSGQPLGKNRT